MQTLSPHFQMREEGEGRKNVVQRYTLFAIFLSEIKKIAYLWCDKSKKMFSKACEYGIRAVLYIAAQSLREKRVKIGDIVQQTGSPEAFTGKILGLLSRQGLVDSYTGPAGGFEIKKEQIRLISIEQIVRAIDGDQFFEGCAMGLSHCDAENPCPMHHSVVKIRENMFQVLKHTTLYDLVTKQGNLELILKR